MAGNLPQHPAYQAPPPAVVAAPNTLVSDPRFAEDVGRMRRAGYNDKDIERVLQQLPEARAARQPTSPVSASPVQASPMMDPAAMATGPAVSGPVTPTHLDGPPPPAPRLMDDPANAGMVGRMQRTGFGDAEIEAQLKADAARSHVVPPPPASSPSMFGNLPTAPSDGMQSPDDMMFMGQMPRPGDPLDPFGGPGPQVGVPMPAGPPPAKPAITPEMMAAFGGPTMPPPGGPGGAPMPTPAAVPGPNPFQGQQPLPMGPTSRPAIGRPPAGAVAQGGATAAGAPPADEGFDYGGIGRNLLEFGLSTMAAGGRPGATLGSAVGEGGLTALNRNTERNRYNQRQAREDRQEKRADKTLTLAEKRQQADEAYRDASVKLQQARLDKDPVASVQTTSDGNLIAITQAGTKIDLKMRGYTKPTYSATDAVDTARKLATIKVADGFGGETEVFDPSIYNAAVEGLGHGSLKIAGGGNADSQANAIRQQYQAGDITREEAERRLQALGGQ